MDNVGMSPRARIVERRTYLRPLNEEGTVFETSAQMKDRVISHQRWLWENQIKRTLNVTEEAELAELRDLMDRSLVTMSGRVKWMGGTELVKARSSAAFNCSFTLVENPADLVDVFWLLLQGCGVGFKPVPGLLEGFNPALTQIEVVQSTRTEKGGEEHTNESYDPATRTWRLTIGDSAKAWAKALGKLLAGKYPATTIILDFSELRPAGKRLKGYGWLSSGWKPLEKAMVRICQLLIEASGRTLTAIEIGDIVNHLGTVLSSRRSAQIWLHDADSHMEDHFVNAKVGRYENGNEHREQSNNSLLFWKKPTRQRVINLLTTILDGGEPGFINAVEAKRRAPDFHGSNPCVTGDTPILTSRGYRPIADLVGHKVDVWNGKEWSETIPFSTGINQLVEVKFSDGTSLTCTPYHKFVTQKDYKGPQTRVEAKDLVVGDKLAKFAMPVVEGNQNPKIDAYSQGFYSGDGTTDYKFSFVYAPKQVCAHRLVGTVSEQKEMSGPQESTRATWRHGEMLSKDFVPLHASVSYKLNWLAGLFDSDGTVLTYDNGKSIQVVSIDQDFLNSVRLMLTTLGVQAKVVKASEAGHTQFRESEKAYATKASWRLLINCQDVYHLHDELGMVCERLDLRQPYPQRDARRFVTVESVTPLDRTEETFCFTEPKNNTGTFNGIVTGQCAEILLPSKGFCNLVQVVWHRFNGNLSALLRAQYIAGRANYRQTCVEMKDGVLQLAWDNNQHLLRLCGVAPLGYVSWDGMGNRYMLEQVRDAAIAGADSMADEFGTPRPRRVTQVQPGGCRPWYALTTTDRGLLTMQEMFAERSTDDAWENYSGKASVLQDGKFVPIKSTFVNGVKPVYRVNLNYGLTLDCTSNHPWFVKTRLSASGRSARSIEVNEWVETKDLTERDILEVQIGAYTNTDHAPFTSVPRLAVDLSMASTEIKQPTMMNEDLGWLFGYLWGDGCLSPSKFRLRFIDQHPDILEKAKRIVREQFGIEGAITKCSDKNAHRLEIASRHLWFWLHRNGVHKYLADKIDVLPQIVRSSSRSDILAFIAGLIDSDGAVVGRKDGKKRFVITTADQFFSQHLQHVSWAVGIAFGASHQAMGTSYQNRKSLYSLTASAHCNPDAVRELMSHSIKMTRNYSAMEFACLAADPKKRTLIGRVRSVDEIGEMETYDIEVDGEPWYLNGVVKSHNTSSKHLGLDGDEVHEGAHLALSRWIFNNINVSKGEPLLDALKAANYRVKDHPFDPTAALVTIPVEYPASPLFTRKTMVIDGMVEVVEVNEESAVSQLERYRVLMESYVQHNCSITVSFDESEIEEMADWFMTHWDTYVGVSFLKRNDPTKTAADLGFAYLPQEAVSKRMYDEYVSTLLPLDLSTDDSGEMLDMGDCSTGACPIR